MSTADSKLEQHRDTEGPARRTYASLEATRGYAHESGVNEVVSICPMDVRTYWRHVGSGKWNSPSAVYEEVTP